jgi:hypothetical protein
MKSKYVLALALSSALLCTLTGCGKSEAPPHPSTAGATLDHAVDKATEAANKGAEKAEEAKSDLNAAAKDIVQDTAPTEAPKAGE